jgi:hypothetical protein
MDYRSDPAAAPYRGIRNNNPGNLKTGIAWQGTAGDDGTFIIFADTSWGIRALATDLANKMGKDGLTTIRAIVSVYAPPSENNTAAYIASVSSDTGIGPDDPLNKDQATLQSLVRAIINHEEGAGPSRQFISDDDIVNGIGMMQTSLLTLFQAGVVAVQSNPLTTLAFLVGGAILLGALFSKGKE